MKADAARVDENGSDIFSVFASSSSTLPPSPLLLVASASIVHTIRSSIAIRKQEGTILWAASVPWTKTVKENFLFLVINGHFHFFDSSVELMRRLSRSLSRCSASPPPPPPPRRRLRAAVAPPEISPRSHIQLDAKRRRCNKHVVVQASAAAAPAALIAVAESASSSLSALLSTLSSSSSSSSDSVAATEIIMPFSSLSFFHLTDGEKHALTLSTLAGMSTTLGALIAIIRRPDAADLAFLLGVALGVMGVLSVCEMWLRNGSENGIVPVSLAFAGGAVAYALLTPLLPEVSTGGRWSIGGGGSEDGGAVGDAAETEKLSASPSSSSSSGARGGARRGAATPPPPPTPTTAAAAAAAASKETPPPAPQPPPLNPAQLLRLGFVMAVAMTLHNLPEGFAVAFSSFTPLGPVMASAIALHNVPEGVVVAAPVFAATGSRLAALGLAAASGLSEPVGAAAALFLARPWLLGEGARGGTPAAAAAATEAASASAESKLSLVLAASGGVMAAVCAVDLFPQGRKCAAPSRLAAGSALGALAMAATLALGV